MGGIDGGWSCGFDAYSGYRLNNNSEETCPECGGSGKDNYTLDCKCWKCNGLGTIREREDT